MKKEKSASCTRFAKVSIGVILIIVGLMALPSVVAYTLGSPTSPDSLLVFGDSARFTCEWSNGSQALLIDAKGHRRLVELGAHQAKLMSFEVGSQYKVVMGIQCRFGRLPARISKVS